MAFQIPNVTIDHLRDFHAKHFPHAPLPEYFCYAAATKVEEEHVDYGDDGLGYYEDGVKRTLTDEQIAMFRHTEIHTILLQRRRKREATDSPEPEPQPKRTSSERKLGCDESARSPGTDDQHLSFQGAFHDSPLGVLTGSTSSSSKSAVTNDPGDEPGDEHVEKPSQWRKRSKAQQQRQNAKNRKAHRKKRADQRKKRREGSIVSGKTGEDESDEWDPWHQANGPDAQKDTPVDLNY